MAATPPPYGSGRTLCRLPAPITESSGIVASARHDGVLFTHNDSGDRPRFYAIDRSCRLLATVDVAGASAVDWEDIAKGPGRNGAPSIFLGDIGDNGATRRSITVYEVPEPDIGTGSTGTHLTVRTVVHRFTYDDGPHDAETLLVEPRSGRIVIVTKSTTGTSGVYTATGSVLHRVAAIDFLAMASGPSLNRSPIAIIGAGLATGGDVAPDGSRVVVRTYAEAFEWPAVDGDVVRALAATPRRVRLPNEQQGEAIGYTSDGRDLITTSEGAGAPLDVVPAAPVGATGSPATGAPAPAGRRPSRRSSPSAAGVTAILSASLVGLVGVVVMRVRRRRRGSADAPVDGR